MYPSNNCFTGFPVSCHRVIKSHKSPERPIIADLLQNEFYPLRPAVRISLRAADPQYVRGASVSSVKTPVVIPVRVYSSQKPFGRAQSELHPVFAAHLAHCTSTENKRFDSERKKKINRLYRIYRPNTPGCSGCPSRSFRKNRIPARSRRTPDCPCRRTASPGRSARSSLWSSRTARFCEYGTINNTIRLPRVLTEFAFPWKTVVLACS